MEAMAAILDGTGMQASLDGKMILVVKNGQQTEAPAEYSGKVVDASGPVPGAMILLDGKKDNVAMTDLDGNFSIKASSGTGGRVERVMVQRAARYAARAGVDRGSQ